jgi:hypothetical protein
VENGEFAVGRGMDVQLDDIGAGIEAGPDRGNGVFEIAMRRRQHLRRRAGVVGQAALVETLGDPPMRQQRRLAGPMADEKTAIVEVDGGHDGHGYSRRVLQFPAQGTHLFRRRRR